MGNNDYMVGCNPSSVIAYEDSTLRHMYPTMAKVDTSWVDYFRSQYRGGY